MSVPPPLWPRMANKIERSKQTFLRSRRNGAKVPAWTHESLLLPISPVRIRPNLPLSFHSEPQPSENRHTAISAHYNVIEIAAASHVGAVELEPRPTNTNYSNLFPVSPRSEPMKNPALIPSLCSLYHIVLVAVLRLRNSQPRRDYASSSAQPTISSDFFFFISHSSFSLHSPARSTHTDVDTTANHITL